MRHINSIQSFIERDEQIDRTQRRIAARQAELLEAYQDGGELLCGDCGGSCQTHTWDKRQQVWIGECCRLPVSNDAAPDNYAAQQVAILEHVVGIEEHAELLNQALSHLRMARMQSSGPLVHVEIAEKLLEQIRRAA